MEPTEYTSQRKTTKLLFIFMAMLVLALIGWQVQRALTKEDAEYGLYRNTLADIRTDLSSKTSVAAATDSAANIAPVVSYRPDNYDFMVMVSNSDGQAVFTVGDTGAPGGDGLSRDAFKILENAGYKEIEDYPTTELLGESGKAYEDDKTVCAVSVQAVLGVTCADKAQFKTAAEDLKEFVEIYRTNYPDLNEEAYAGRYGFLEYGMGDGDSKYAIMSTGTTAAYFYQEEDRWKYYTSSPEGLSCAGDFNQNDFAKAAFSKVCRPSGAPSS